MLKTPIFLRVHTEALNRPNIKRKAKPEVTKWPDTALVFDCETTIDERQALILGAYRYCRNNGEGGYTCVEEGFFHDDGLQHDDPAFSILTGYVKSTTADAPQEEFSQKLKLMSRSEFVKRVFWPAILDNRSLVVAFNLPFDLSRIALV